MVLVPVDLHCVELKLFGYQHSSSDNLLLCSTEKNKSYKHTHVLNDMRDIHFLDELTIYSLGKVIWTRFLAIRTGIDCIEHLKRIRWNGTK